MTKGLARSLSRGQFAGTQVKRKVIPIRDLALTVDGASGVGFGSAVIGDFEEGNILFLGAVGYIQATGPTSADLADDWEGDFAVGTTPAGDGTLTGADVDILPATAFAAATAEASPRTRAANATQAVFDNTDGSLEINLSILVDDADIGADGIAMTVNGELFIAYLVLGDD